MSTATTIIPRAARTYQWTTGQRRSFAQPFPNAFLPSTHWVPAKIPFDANGNEAICRIYPRPDSECNAWARHKWFYYDGTNQLSQVIPLGARGGAWPYVWVIMAAPAQANATIGSIYQGGMPGANYGGYGDLVVTPTGSFTNATFWVRAYGQDGDYLDFLWTASTTSSTTYFVFVDIVNGKSTNAGTISAPIDGLETAFGSASLDTTFPNATLVMRSGTYPTFQQTGAGGGIQFSLGNSPGGIMAYPGDSPSIDITNGAGGFCFGWDSNVEDVFLQGLELVGVSAANANEAYRHFWPGSPTYRFMAHDLSFPNVYSGENQANNSTSIYWSDPGLTNAYSQYIFLKALSETGRGSSSNPTNGQNYGIACMYGTSRGLAEFCSVSDSSATENVYLKASCLDWTRRANSLIMTPAAATGGFVLSTSNQVNDDGYSGNLEQCYNLVVNPEALTDSSLSFTRGLNASAFDNADTNEWWYRNTVVGSASVYQMSGNGPFQFEDEAIQWGPGASGPIYYSVAGGNWSDALPLPSMITNVGNTSCQAQTGVVDSTTYMLTGTYRTQYLGQCGCEVE